MSRILFGIILVLSILSIFTAGCANTNEISKSNAENTANDEQLSESDAQQPDPPKDISFKPVSIVDASGAELAFTDKVERIACVVSLCIDIAAELGLEPVAIGESGVRFIASQPEFFGSMGESFPSIGGSFFEPNLEDIITARPDLVIGLRNVHDVLREGLRGVAPIYLANPNSYTESIEILEAIGRVTGREAEAEAAKEVFLKKLQNAKETSPNDKKALIMYGSDVNFGIVTDNSIGGTVLKEVTLYPWKVTDPSQDPFGDGGIPFSLEKVLEEDPDVIFVESYSFSPDTKPLSEQLAVSPLWGKLKAVREGQVHEMRSPIWGDGRGTRSIGILLDEAMKILYPQ